MALGVAEQGLARAGAAHRLSQELSLEPGARHGELGADRVPKKRARAECRDRGAKFAVPRTGVEAQLLREAMRRAGAGKALLGYAERRGEWVALDERRP